MVSSLPTSMRAVEIADGRLRATQLALPQPASGEVLVRVAYTGINRADLFQVAGSYPPPEGASPLPGMEVSGIIASDSGTWKAGTPVCALIAGGGYAEYATVPLTQLLPIPHGISLCDAASLPEAAATAYMALVQEAQLQHGERVLLHGGSSGVGLMMAQVAKALGAEVFATAGGAEKCAFVRGLGVTAIDHSAAPFGEQVMAATNNEGVDVVIDTLGGPHLNTHLKLLRKGGRLVCLALLDGAVADSVKLSGLLLKHLTLRGATLRSRGAAQKAAIIRGVVETVWPHLASGAIRPVVDSVFPLEQAEKAHQRMQERLHCGKILLEVAP